MANSTEELELAMRRARLRIEYLEKKLQVTTCRLQDALNALRRAVSGLELAEGDLRLSDPLLLRLAELEFGARACRAFKTLHIETVGHLVEVSVSDLLRVGNCGRKTMKEIRDVLEELGLKAHRSLG